MIVYYTGTGNSRRAAQLLSDRLQDGIFDVFPCLKENRPLSLRSERPWIFVAPTYGWQLPHVFRDLILNADLQGSRDAYFVMTCGAGVGNAEQYLRQLCDKKGLTFKGLQPLVMPENYIAMFPVPDERAASVLIKKADKQLGRAVPLIAQGLALPAVKAGLAGKAMSGVVNTVFTRGVVTAKPFRVTADCTGCGHPYYVRLPKAFADQLPCDKVKEDGDIARVITKSVTVKEMHDLAAQLRQQGAQVFFAGIEE